MLYIDGEVQVGPQVLGVHAGEAPEVALEPRAQVFHQLHRRELFWVPHVYLAGPVREPVLPDEDVVGGIERKYRAGLRVISTRNTTGIKTDDCSL